MGQITKKNVDSGRFRRLRLETLEDRQLLSASAAPQIELTQHAALPKNVILLIADGAGFNTFLAADYYQYGAKGS